MAVYKLTEEQRKQVAEILGVEDPETLSEKIYDHEEFSGVTKKRDEFKRKTSELQTQVEELQPRVLTEEDLAEYKNLKREKKERKTSQSDPSELDALRETLTAQHRQEIGVIESDRDFWKNLTESKLRDQELIVQASKLGFQDPNDALVLRNRIRIDVTGEGDSRNILVKVRDESGKAWFTNEGNEGTVEDLVKDLADRKPYLLKKNEERVVVLVETMMTPRKGKRQDSSWMI